MEVTHRHRFFLFIIDFVIKVHYCHTIPPNGFSLIMIRQQKKKAFLCSGTKSLFDFNIVRRMYLINARIKSTWEQNWGRHYGHFFIFLFYNFSPCKVGWTMVWTCFCKSTYLFLERSGDLHISLSLSVCLLFSGLKICHSNIQMHSTHTHAHILETDKHTHAMTYFSHTQKQQNWAKSFYHSQTAACIFLFCLMLNNRRFQHLFY